VRPVGETKSEKLDVRVVAATLRDLGKLVERSQFREDLYYRLNVVNLQVPPLRDRGEDILLLARHFLNRFNRELNREKLVTGFSPDVESMLLSYRWPGNVRELENAIERAVLLAESDQVVPQNLPDRIWSPPSAASERESLMPVPTDSSQLSLKRAIREIEETYIRAALRRTKGNRTRAAEVLEISHRALLYKIKEYGIDPDAEGERN
jgi:two-component system response regulator AtoC